MKHLKSALLGCGWLAYRGHGHSAERAVRSDALATRVGPYAAGGSGIFGGYIDYLNLLNLARRRHQRRQAGLRGVRDRVQQRAWRRVLRTAEEEEHGRVAGDAAVDRHHLFVDREGDRRQDPGHLDRLWPHRCLRRPRVSRTSSR